MIRDDLCEFILDICRIDFLATSRRQGFCCLRDFALLHEVSRTLREKKEPCAKYNGPKKLNGDGDTIGAAVIAILGRVAHHVGNEDSEGDAKVVPGDQCPADLFRCDFLLAVSVLEQNENNVTIYSLTYRGWQRQTQSQRRVPRSGDLVP